jgi:hypothetical protein
MRQIVVQMVWSSGGAGSGSPSKVTDRTLANQLGALAEDCERRAEQAAQADAVEASARKGMNSSPQNLALARDCRPHEQCGSLKGRLKGLKTSSPVAAARSAAKHEQWRSIQYERQFR